MTRRARLVIAAALLCVAGNAQASTNSGIDTPQGVHILPLATEGNAIINLTDTPSISAAVEGSLTTIGSVGVGVAAPAAPLDVDGGVHANNSSTVTTGGCSPEGMLAYDAINHVPIYCKQSGTWAVIGGSTTLTCTVATGVGTATCGAGQTVTGGGCNVGNYGDSIYTSMPQGNGWYCVYFKNSGQVIGPAPAYAVCCG
jgi:hypothetical protein